MVIDSKLPIPVYFQLKTLLLEEILEGRYGLDGRLPTEHELCARHRISRTPVTRALSELAAEGVVIRHRRRGTFVNPHWVRRHREGPELRVIVPEGPWEGLLRRAAPADTRLSVATVELHELHQALTHAVAEGLGPDLAVLDSVWVPEFTAAGFLAPLEELDEGWISGEYEHDFLTPLMDAGRAQGRTFGVHAEADVAGLWYRRAPLEALGLGPPATWSELRAAGHALAATAGRDTHPVVLPGGSKAGEAATYILLALLASNRAAVLHDGVVALDSPATIETLQFLRALVVDGVMPVEVVALEWDRPIRLLAHGAAAICFGGSYEAPRLAEAAGLLLTELWDHFGFAPVPGGPRGAPATLAGGMVYGIFRQATHPKLAMRLLEAVTSAEALARMSRATGQIPSRRSAVAQVTGDSALLATTAELLQHAVVRPATPAYARLSVQLQAMLEAVLTGRLEPPAATARAAELIGAVTGLPLRGH
jgi:ABC-type glycerol-3-phosphate transport system substrate-binding protein/DNA-binding transcriptional regulator YhcF (GntR family)